MGHARCELGRDSWSDTDPQGGRLFRQRPGEPSRGVLVLDGIDLLRGAFIRMDDYSLDAVARAVLGEGKAIVTAPARDRLAEILA